MSRRALLGTALILFGDRLDDNSQQIFQTVLMLLAAGLIVQMVLWMRRHGRTLKRDLETALQGAADKGNWWGVFTLAAIAVAREGCETVVFLAGTLSAARNGGFAPVVFSAAGGLALAVATYGLLQLGGKILSWRTFFRVTEILLLLLAGALLLTAADQSRRAGPAAAPVGPAVGRVKPAVRRGRFRRVVRLSDRLAGAA